LSSAGGSAPAYHQITSQFARKSSSNTRSSGLELRLEYHQNQSLPSATISGWRALGGISRISLQMTNVRLAHENLLRGIELLGTGVAPLVREAMAG